MAGFNPNRKKKTYSFNRSQPSRLIATLVDGKVEYFDETLVSVDSPFYALDTATSQGVPPAQYDEDVVDFIWTDSEPVSFNVVFTQVPYLTLEILPANGYENVATFASYLTTTGFTANISAPFSGQLVYRAIVASSFPATVERVVASSSFYYTASAGSVAMGSNDTLLASYSSLSTNPSFVFFTPIDDDNNGVAGVGIVATGSFGLVSTPVTFSAPVYNSVHYLAVKP